MFKKMLDTFWRVFITCLFIALFIYGFAVLAMESPKPFLGAMLILIGISGFGACVGNLWD